MKNILSEMKAKEYFCRLTPVQAKKVVFVMSRLGNGERMSETTAPEVKHIADMFDGVIQGSYASELAASLMASYIKEYPGSFMSQKEAKTYTDADYGKLYTALGLKGFDYVLDVLRAAKALIHEPASTVDETRVLQALRWKEVREDRNAQISDIHHHKRGLELMGFGEMAEILKDYSFIIANVYEKIVPAGRPIVMETTVSSVRQMKIHFIEAADVIEAFYSVEQPVEPKDYDKAQLAEGSILLDLATKGQLKDSETILEYYKANVAWESAEKRLKKEFSDEECEVIRKNPEVVKELIKSTW